MARIQNRKGNFYCQKQFIRDELSAPKYLESAGDLLIKNLAKKQMNTRTSLQEQLEIVQNFEKGFDLNPENRKGVTCLEEFKKDALEESDTSPSSDRMPITDFSDLMREKGLTRHELELDLCEKPNSAVSQLYMFAKGSRSQKRKLDLLGSKHPLNQLKKIEEECFGQNKKTKSEPEPPQEVKQKGGKRKKHRKRKKKGASNNPEKRAFEPEARKSPICLEGMEYPKAAVSRPSLWDVKDMKKWSECKKIGCKPRALYTIKNGKIIKLEEGSQSEDVT